MVVLASISLSSYQDVPSDIEPSSKEGLELSMSIGLSWSKWLRANNRQVGDATRRHDFPSWSWCGWKTSPVWRTRTVVYEDSFASIPQDIRIQSIESATLPLSEEVAASLSMDQHLATGFTYCLHMRAEILDIRVEYLDQAVSFPWVWDASKEKTRYAVKVVGESEGGSEDAHVHLWAMETTPAMDENHELHTMLCTQVVQCIILAKPWGLVVYMTQAGVCERIGLIHVLAGSDAHPAYAKHNGPHLREYFPGSVRDIVLG